MELESGSICNSLKASVEVNPVGAVEEEEEEEDEESLPFFFVWFFSLSMQSSLGKVR